MRRPGFTVAGGEREEMPRVSRVRCLSRGDGWLLEIAILRRDSFAPVLSVRTMLQGEPRSRIQFRDLAEIEALEAACRRWRQEVETPR